MPKFTMPFYEPLPYYMSAIGMQGARFIDGNDGSGAGAGDEDKSGSDKPNEDEELREPGKRALEAERAARKEAEKKLTKLQEAETAREREQMTETERLKSELEDERKKNAALATQTAVRGLLIDHRLAASDGELLTAVSDPVQREALAKRLAAVPSGSGDEDDSKRNPGSLSGTGGGASSTGSIADYRREISEKRAL